MASSNNLSFKIFKQNNIFIINKMNILTEKANHNLKCILEMKENDTYIGQRGKLVPQEDFIQVNNIVDLEYAIYFTFHHYFCNGDTDQIYNNNIIQKLDTCIDNLYDNKQFNELFNEEQFGEIMNDIDNKLTDIKDKYYYKSPFFIFFKKYHNLYKNCLSIFNENNLYMKRLLRHAQMDHHRSYYVEEEEKEAVGEEEEEEEKEEEKGNK